MGDHTVSTYHIEICIAGNLDDAKRTCRSFCFNVGLCVTVTPTDYVYTGGQEAGVIVRLINYPRFPTTKEQMWEVAVALGARLKHDLCQNNYSLVADDKTQWFEGAKNG